MNNYERKKDELKCVNCGKYLKGREYAFVRCDKCREKQVKYVRLKRLINKIDKEMVGGKVD